MANRMALSANFGHVYNLPSSVLKHILREVFSRDNPHPIEVLLVNKRFYALAKRLLLTTIYLRSELTVLQLLRCLARGQSNPTHNWSEVREIELLFSPSLSRVRLTGTDIFARVMAFCNLHTIRFVFDSGIPYVPGMSDSQVHDLLASNGEKRNDWMRSDSPIYKFLSIQNPRTFEWHATGPNLGDRSVEGTAHFRLQTFSGTILSLFESWQNLTRVHLHDLCLLNLLPSSFSVALPADNVHIKACASLGSMAEAWSFFSISSRLEGSPYCQQLILELMNDLRGPQLTFHVGRLPLGTVLSVVGLSSDQRRMFTAMFPNGSQFEVDTPGEAVSEETAFNDDVSGHEQEIATATALGLQDVHTRSATQINIGSSTKHRVFWLLFRIPNQLSCCCASVVTYGTRITIRSVDFTITDLQAYLQSIRHIQNEGHQAPSNIAVGFPHITQVLISVIFASLLAWRTLLVFIRTVLTEIRAFVSSSELCEDRIRFPANSEDIAICDLRSSLSPYPSGPLLTPLREDCMQGCASHAFREDDIGRTVRN